MTKYTLLLLFLLTYTTVARGQTHNPPEKIVITAEEGKTQLRTDANGTLMVNVAPEDVQAMAYPVLRHRLLLSFQAQAEGTTANKVVERLLQMVAAS